MNVNISLVGQMITFGILIWVTMKFVWPPLLSAIEKRNKEISDGLTAAAEGKQALEDAHEKRVEIIKDARAKQLEHVTEGKNQRDEIIKHAATEAEAERERIIAEGRKSVEQERLVMVRELQENYSDLVVAGVEKIVRRTIDAEAHKDIVDDMIKELK